MTTEHCLSKTIFCRVKMLKNLLMRWCKVHESRTSLSAQHVWIRIWQQQRYNIFHLATGWYKASPRHAAWIAMVCWTMWWWISSATTHLSHIEGSISVSPRWRRDQCHKWPSVGGTGHSRSLPIRAPTSSAGWLLWPCRTEDLEGIATLQLSCKKPYFFKAF